MFIALSLWHSHCDSLPSKHVLRVDCHNGCWFLVTDIIKQMTEYGSHLVQNDVSKSMHVFIIDQFLQQNTSCTVQQPCVFTHFTIHTNLTSQTDVHRFLLSFSFLTSIRTAKQTAKSQKDAVVLNCVKNLNSKTVIETDQIKEVWRQYIPGGSKNVPLHKINFLTTDRNFSPKFQDL